MPTKRKADMTPAEVRESLRAHLISWAFLAEEQGGNPYHCVNAYGEPWKYATSFLNYSEGEAIGALSRDGHSVIYLLMIAATLDHAPS